MIFILDDRKDRQDNMLGHYALPSHIQPADVSFISAFKSAQIEKAKFRDFLYQKMPKDISILCVHSSSLFSQIERLTELQKFTTKKNPPIPLIKFSGGNSLVSTEKAGLVFNANVRTFYQRLFHTDNSTPHGDPLRLLFGSGFHLAELMNLRRWLTLYFEKHSRIEPVIIASIRNYEDSGIVQSLFESFDKAGIQNATKSDLLKRVTQKINELIN